MIFFNEIEATPENNTEPANCGTNETSLCEDMENSNCSAVSQKSVRSASYARALKGFSMEFMESQRQLQIKFFEQQSKLNNEYFEKQKAWEEKVLQKEEEIALAD
ncbi:Uncharacterized protein FWK35_00035622 [Aphis craccivora]|uniref:Uncharacterized protein n=1 Tax=Aphis craccivora TaxID=307492 RepID=A0A6G0VSA9_APHCR|nr:Uncharacterized protein FWK35_00035622 [Aphis craccivora]